MSCGGNLGQNMLQEDIFLKVGTFSTVIRTLSISLPWLCHDSAVLRYSHALVLLVRGEATLWVVCTWRVGSIIGCSLWGPRRRGKDDGVGGDVTCQQSRNCLGKNKTTHAHKVDNISESLLLLRNQTYIGFLSNNPLDLHHTILLILLMNFTRVVPSLLVLSN